MDMQVMAFHSTSIKSDLTRSFMDMQPLGERLRSVNWICDTRRINFATDKMLVNMYAPLYNLATFWLI